MFEVQRKALPYQLALAKDLSLVQKQLHICSVKLTKTTCGRTRYPSHKQSKNYCYRSHYTLLSTCHGENCPSCQTLFKSQIFLAEYRCSTNWGDCKSNQIKSNLRATIYFPWMNACLKTFYEDRKQPQWKNSIPLSKQIPILWAGQHSRSRNYTRFYHKWDSWPISFGT